MSMKFYLMDNPLTPDPNDFRAVIVKKAPKKHRDLIKFVLHRSAGLTESQIASVLKEYDAAIDYYLEEGEIVETERYTITPRIKGVFNSIDEPFDQDKHQVHLKLRPNATLKALAKKIKVERVEEVKNMPLPQVCTDIESKTKNELLTPGKVARLTGKRLKFNEEDPTQGIFLIDESEKEIKVERIIDNLPKTLTFMVPDKLKAGTYTVKIKSGLSTKEIREAKLERKLSVA